MLDLAPIQIFFLLIGVGFVFTGISMVFLKAFPEKRSSHLKDIAFQLGFSFREKGDGSITRDFSSLPFFHSCKNGLEENVMTKGMGQAFVAILDFSRSRHKPDASGKSDENGNISQTQTLVCFKSNHLDLPPIFLQPDRYFDPLWAKYLEENYALHPVECQTFPTFSRYFRVYGKEEAKIRRIIQNSGLNHLCEKEKDLCIEGEGPLLIVYRFKKQMAPQETEIFFDLAHQVHNILEHGMET